MIPTTNTDLVWPDDPNRTQNIVLQALPLGPFTATAKLALAPRSAFQQAGLVVYGDDDNYVKAVFQARGDNDAASRRFEFLSEVQGQTSGSMSPKLDASYPDVVWVRLTSDGRTVRAGYSADGQEFAELPETERFNATLLEVIPAPMIGLLSLAGIGTTPIIEARFDWFELCQPANSQRARP